MRSCWIRVGLKFNNSCCYKKIWWWRQKLEGCSYTPRNVKSCQQPQEPRRRKGGFFSKAFWRSMALPTPWFPSSNLQTCERINFCFLRYRFVVICYSSPRTLIHSYCGPVIVPVNWCTAWAKSVVLFLTNLYNGGYPIHLFGKVEAQFKNIVNIYWNIIFIVLKCCYTLSHLTQKYIYWSPKLRVWLFLEMMLLKGCLH